MKASRVWHSVRHHASLRLSPVTGETQQFRELHTYSAGTVVLYLLAFAAICSITVSPKGSSVERIVYHLASLTIHNIGQHTHDKGTKNRHRIVPRLQAGVLGISQCPKCCLGESWHSLARESNLLPSSGCRPYRFRLWEETHARNHQRGSFQVGFGTWNSRGEHGQGFEDYPHVGALVEVHEQSKEWML